MGEVFACEGASDLSSDVSTSSSAVCPMAASTTPSLIYWLPSYLEVYSLQTCQGGKTPIEET